MCQAMEEYQGRIIFKKGKWCAFVELQYLPAVHIQYTYQKALRQLWMHSSKSVMLTCMTLALKNVDEFYTTISVIILKKFRLLNT